MQTVQARYYLSIKHQYQRVHNDIPSSEKESKILKFSISPQNTTLIKSLRMLTPDGF